MGGGVRSIGSEASLGYMRTHLKEDKTDDSSNRLCRKKSRSRGEGLLEASMRFFQIGKGREITQLMAYAPENLSWEEGESQRGPANLTRYHVHWLPDLAEVPMSQLCLALGQRGLREHALSEQNIRLIKIQKGDVPAVYPSSES